MNLATLFVSNDLNVVRLLTDRVAVMYLGKIVEMGPSTQIFEHPAHPYMQAPVSPDAGCGPRVRLQGEIRSPIDPPPQVCRFASRCPSAQDPCSRKVPPERLDVTTGHCVACHFPQPFQGRPVTVTTAPAA